MILRFDRQSYRDSILPETMLPSMLSYSEPFATNSDVSIPIMMHVLKYMQKLEEK